MMVIRIVLMCLLGVCLVSCARSTKYYVKDITNHQMIDPEFFEPLSEEFEPQAHVEFVNDIVELVRG